MTYDEFLQYCNSDGTVPEVSPLLMALYHDAKGEWDRAHEIVQDINGSGASWIHAYLHRKEGDRGNASYWYSRAGKPFCNSGLEEEWNELAINFLTNG